MKRRNYKKTRFTKQTRNLFAKGLFSYDKLEPKNLLAGLAGVDAYQPTPVIDPFAQDAVTYKEMVARAAVTPYMEGELVVAVSAEQGPQFDQWLNSLSWSQLVTGDDVAGVEINSTRTMMTVDRADGTSVALVHIKMAENADIFAAMRELDQDPAVMWSSPNFYQDADPREFTPNDPQYGSQYHHTLMQNNLAWDVTLGDPSIIIGVTDDGVDITHSDLAANIWQNTGELPGDGIDNDGNGYVDDYNGWDFSSGNNNPNHNGGASHGTHVSGIAAGRINNGTGIAGTAGRATIMPLQFYGVGAWTATVINETFTYAADNGAKIVNTSYNIDGWVGDAVFTAGLQYLYDSGAIHVNSAGNGSALNPARQAFEQSLLIASTTSSDTLSSFSNYGTGVDMAAPGSNILSTLPGSTYGLNSGTSMAAPNGAGTAALIWSANPSWNRDQVVAQMLGTGDNIDALNPQFAGLLGGGRVNPFNALTMTLDNPQIETVSDLPGDGVYLDDTTIGQFSVVFNQVMDPASVNASGVFELRNAGVDDIFGTADDTVYTLNTNPYLIGTNQLDFNIAEGPLNYGHYKLTIAATAKNPFMDALDGNGDGTGGDAYEQEFYISPPVEGVVSLDRGSYLVEDTILISVGDSNAVGPIFVSVTTTGGDSETVTLNDAGFGRFEGTINTVSDSVVAGDGALQVALGNIVTVTYNDIDDGTGNPSMSVDTANISNVIQFDAVDTPVAISDNSTVTSVIPVAIAGTVADLDLLLDISHTYVGDLSAKLISPSGVEVTLFSNIGGGSNDFTQTYFDDEASASITSGTAPFTGNFRPEGSFSDFDLGSTLGNWTLSITDSAGGDVGFLNSWSLFIDVTPATLGQVSIDGDGYNVGDTVNITVVDENAVAPVTVDVVASSGDSETVTLSGSNGVYTGSIDIVAGAPAADGFLQANVGDNFVVSYVDSDDGQGNSNTVMTTGFISNISMYASVDVPLNIVDNTTIYSDLIITGAGTVNDLNVELDITHTYDADLDVFLIAPDGTRIELFSDVGGSGNNFTGTILDDEAGVSITAGSAPFTGSYAPEGDLSSFDGMDIAGTWTLEISDDAGLDQGTLNGWGLMIDVNGGGGGSPGIGIQSPMAITEGNTGAVTAEFVVSLSGPSTTVVEVDWATTTTGFTNPATPGIDFQDGMGTLAFQPGQIQKTVSINVFGDRFRELNEEFGIELSNAVGGNITSGSGSVLINDNDTFALGTTIDFGPQDSVVDGSSIGFVIDAYSPALGMGWQNATELTTGTQLRGNDITRDYVSAEDAEFVIDVANGNYEVTVFVGIVGRLEPFNLTIEGTEYRMRPSPGPNVFRTFAANVTDGKINVQMDGGAGFDNTAKISGLVVNQVGGRPTDFSGVKSSIQTPRPITTPSLLGGTGPYIATEPIQIINGSRCRNDRVL